MFTDQNGTRYVLIEEPDLCPRCHTAVKVDVIDSHQITFDAVRGPIAQMVYKCPTRQCGELFIATYMPEQEIRGGYTNRLRLINTEPKNYKEEDIPDELQKLSPVYAEILQQSAQAEKAGLTEIAGMGYRKALEFLVKDYVIKISPEHADKVASLQLMQVIIDYIGPESRRIRECAKRAAWLGNDETHYVRKHTDYDLQDLIRLLRLTATWISSDLQGIDYEEKLQKK